MKAATIARLKSAAHAVKSGAAGAKGTAIATGVGAATGFALSKVADSLPSFLKENWWAIPAAMAVAGHFVKRKNANIGTALCGAAGMYGAIAYSFHSSGAPTTSAKGIFDAQPDAGAMPGYGTTTSAYRDFMAKGYAQLGQASGDAGSLYDGDRGAGALVSDAYGLAA